MAISKDMDTCFSNAPRYLKSLRFRKTIKGEVYFNMKSFFIDDMQVSAGIRSGKKLCHCKELRPSCRFEEYPPSCHFEERSDEKSCLSTPSQGVTFKIPHPATAGIRNDILGLARDSE